MPGRGESKPGQRGELRRKLQSLSEQDKIRALNAIIRRSEHIVFLGGAGVSTESGLPDFRGKNGLYKASKTLGGKYTPEYLMSYDCLQEEPELFFRYYRQYMDSRNARPGPAHLKLAELEQKGKLDVVITQNIDGLHQKAGSKRVLEIHGGFAHNHCVSCGGEYSADFVFAQTAGIPRCPICHRMVRPGITLYGELLPERIYQKAGAYVRRADCLIIGGTSLETGSAQSLVRMFRGRYMIIINLGKARMEGKADMVIRTPIGRVMSQIEV